MKCLKDSDHWKAHKHMDNYPELNTAQSINSGHGWETTQWAWWVNGAVPHIISRPMYFSLSFEIHTVNAEIYAFEWH